MKPGQSPLRAPFLLGAIPGVFLGACSPATPPEPTVKIAAVLDQTGPLANRAWKDSVLLALEEANAGLELAGGFNDVKFGIDVADSISKPNVTMTRARALIGKGALAVITDTGESALALAATQYDADPKNDLGVPVICTACTSPAFGDPFASHFNEVRQKTYRDREHWKYRTSADSVPETKALLASIHARGDRGDINHDGLWKIGLYVIDDDFGNGFVEGFKTARNELFPWVEVNKDAVSCVGTDVKPFCFAGLRIEVIRHPPGISPNAYDYTSDLNLLLDEFNDAPTDNPGRPLPLDRRPDYIVEASYPLFAAGFTRAYIDRQQATMDKGGQATPLFHTHNWRHFQTLVKLLNTEVDGHAGVSHAILDNCEEAGRPFARALFEKTGREPGLWDAQNYDAAMVTMLAALVALGDMTPPDVSQLKGTHIRDAMSRVNSQSPDAVRVTGGAEGFRRAIEAIRQGLPIDYVGASGPVDFDRNGNVKNDFVSFEVVNGLFVDTQTHGCARDEKCAVTDGACSWK